MKVTVKKGAKSDFKLNIKEDSLIGKMIAGAQGKVTIRTPFGTYEPKKKNKKTKSKK